MAVPRLGIDCAWSGGTSRRGSTNAATAFLATSIVGLVAASVAVAGDASTALDIPPGLSPNLQSLIRKTFSPSEEERLEAVHKLGELGPRASPAVPSLIRLLGDKNRETRWTAIDVLSSLHDRRAVEPLIALLNDRDCFVAGCAAFGLRNLADPRVVPALLGALSSTTTCDDVRKHAAWTLGFIGDPCCIEALLAVVKRRDIPATVRSGALDGLSSCKQRRVIDEMSAILVDADEDRTLRIASARTLSDLEDRAAAATLACVARNRADDVLVRFWAAMDLVVVTDGTIGDLEVARALDIPPGMLPPGDPIGMGDEDALHARRAVFHLVSEHGTTLAVRSTARRLLRSVWGVNNRNYVVYILVTAYFVLALTVWAIVYRGWLRRCQLTLRSLMILVAIVAFGMGIPMSFDALVPSRFDDPAWHNATPETNWSEARNHNLPGKAILILAKKRWQSPSPGKMEWTDTKR
jgi:HEAT repeat protein